MVWCHETICLSKLFVHLKDDHGTEYAATVVDNKVQHMNLSIPPNVYDKSNAWVHFPIILHEGKQFYSQFARSETGLFFLWVYMIGTPKEEENFTYTLTLFNANKVSYLGLICRALRHYVRFS